MNHLRVAEAAEHLRLSKSTLDKLRCHGADRPISNWAERLSVRRLTWTPGWPCDGGRPLRTTTPRRRLHNLTDLENALRRKLKSDGYRLKKIPAMYRNRELFRHWLHGDQRPQRG